MISSLKSKSTTRELKSLRSLLARGNFGKIPWPELGSGMYPCAVYFFSKLRSYDGGNFGPWVSFEMFFFTFCVFKLFQFPVFLLNLVLLALQSLMSVDSDQMYSHPMSCQQAFSDPYLFFPFNMNSLIPETCC